jgi:hypothetical protein
MKMDILIIFNIMDVADGNTYLLHNANSDYTYKKYNVVFIF